MKLTQHNVMNMVHHIFQSVEAYFAQAKEGRYLSMEARLAKAECLLAEIAEKSKKAYAMLKYLSRLTRRPPQDAISMRSKVSLKKIWRQILLELGRNHAADSLQFIDRIPQGFPLIVCQRDAFRQILCHILENALEHCPPSGKLVIRAELSISKDEKQKAVITIADNGPGIDEQDLNRIFKPFYSGKKSKKGNGLGLFVAEELARANGGSISVSSFEGFGTTFTLEFPIAMSSYDKLTVRQV